MNCGSSNESYVIKYNIQYWPVYFRFKKKKSVKSICLFANHIFLICWYRGTSPSLENSSLSHLQLKGLQQHIRMFRGSDAVARFFFIFFYVFDAIFPNFNKWCNTRRETDFTSSTFFRKRHRKLFILRKPWFCGIFQTLSPPTTFKMEGCAFLHFHPRFSL